MTNTTVSDHQVAQPPVGTIGQFFVRGTVFYVAPETSQPARYPFVEVAANFQMGEAHGETLYRLYPETVNGVSPFDDDDIPAGFWRDFYATTNTWFAENIGAITQCNTITRLVCDEIVIDQLPNPASL